ncbi:hypothetical protein GCM10029978_067940 [Actinoallomurus acanthiterrae]
MTPQEKLADAVLGSILHDPGHLLLLAAHEVHPVDFVNPVHQKLGSLMYTLLNTKENGGKYVFNLTVEEDKHRFLAVIYEQAHNPASAFSVTDLERMKNTCEQPRLIAEYMYRIVELQALEVIRAHATRLARELNSANDKRDGIGAVFKHVGRTEAVLATLAERLKNFRQEPSEAPSDAASVDEAPAEEPVSAQWWQRRPRLPDLETYRSARREDQLIASLVQHPEQISLVRHWLSPEDFTDGRRAKLYSLLLDLDQRVMPITPLLVVGDAQVHGLIPAHPRSADRLLKRLERRTVVAAVHVGKEILDASAARNITAEIDALQAAADNPARRAIPAGLAALNRIRGVKEGHAKSYYGRAPYIRAEEISSPAASLPRRTVTAPGGAPSKV